MPETFTEYRPNYRLEILLGGDILLVCVSAYSIFILKKWIIFWVICGILMLIYALLRALTLSCFKRCCVPPIRINQNSIIFIDSKTKVESIIRKNKIKRVLKAKVGFSYIFGLELKNPKTFVKEEIDKGILVRPHKLGRLINYLLLRRKIAITLPEIMSDDKKVAYKYILKIQKYNYNKYGFHIQILPQFYYDDDKLFTDLQKLVSQKSK